MTYRHGTSLLLQNPDDRSSINRMDMEVGKVVETWRVKADDKWNVEDAVLKAFGPPSKFANTTTILGLSHNTIYTIC
jgi:hypothetical protein